jgi:hypothetical protein
LYRRVLPVVISRVGNKAYMALVIYAQVRTYGYGNRRYGVHGVRDPLPVSFCAGFAIEQGCHKQFVQTCPCKCNKASTNRAFAVQKEKLRQSRL